MESQEQKLINDIIAEQKENSLEDFKRQAKTIINEIAAHQKQIAQLQLKIAEQQKKLKELKVQEFSVQL